MTMERVRQEAISFVVGFSVGLVVVLTLLNLGVSNQLAVLLAGVAVAIVAGIVVHRLAFGRWPDLESRRPARFSVPMFLGLFLGLMVTGLLQRDDPSYALAAYVIGLAVVMAGVVASDVLWARGLAQREDP
jgi:phosphatidylserine synthase